ncbi:sugar nucleotide-binding protein [Actinoallomurus sp. NPDC050550]|uniref:SDR family oxidoreductase n=1 Tax=Actinoallomurus sp. NPDC050550 TaxID=3154937 RepID=UPI0033E7AE4D
MSNSMRTIVVTSANSRTGRHLLPRLADRGSHVIALTRTPEDLPADEVIPDWTRSPEATKAIANASAVIHLSGVFAARDEESYEVGNVATARLVAEAAGPSCRPVYVSYVAADSAHPNWYVRSKGRAEDVLRRSGTDSVIFRIHPIAGGRQAPSPFELMFRQARPDAPVRVIGDGTQRFRPVHADDVVDALIKAAEGAGRTGTYDLVGPSEFTVTEMVERINGRSVPIERVSVEQAASMPWPPPTVADLLAHPDAPADPDAVAEIFGLSPTRVEATWPLASA